MGSQTIQNSKPESFKDLSNNLGLTWRVLDLWDLGFFGKCLAVPLVPFAVFLDLFWTILKIALFAAVGVFCIYLICYSIRILIS